MSGMRFLAPRKIGNWIMKGTECEGRLDIFFENEEGATLSFTGTKEEWDNIMEELKGVM